MKERLAQIGVGIAVVAWFAFGAVQCVRESIVTVPPGPHFDNEKLANGDIEELAKFVDGAPPLEPSVILTGVIPPEARILGAIVRADGLPCDSVGVVRARSEREFRIACNAGSLLYAVTEADDGRLSVEVFVPDD